MSGPQTAEGWVLKLARDRKDLTNSELHVLAVLAMRHNRDFGAAHPKVELLHRETHISLRQVLRVLNALADTARPGGAVLHISFGPLPMENKAGNPVYGNVYRFIDFDPIPDNARPRRRDVVDSRPKASDTMSHGLSDATSHARSDTGDAGNVTSEGGACDTGNAGNVTSANSPLYPVKNPALKRSEERLREINPDLNPVRERAQGGHVDDEDGVVERWPGVLMRVRSAVSAADFDKYLAGTRPLAYSAAQQLLVAETREALHLPWLLGRFGTAIEKAVGEEFGQAVRVDWRTALPKGD